MHLLDAGHFALELHAKEVASHILDFKKQKGLCGIRKGAMAAQQQIGCVFMPVERF